MASDSVFPVLKTHLFYQAERRERGQVRGCCPDVQLLHSWTSAWLSCPRPAVLSAPSPPPRQGVTVSNHVHAPSQEVPAEAQLERLVGQWQKSWLSGKPS